MADLFDELRNADSLPSPPGVALEIVRLLRDRDVEVADLAAALRRDPAIVARLLRAANSAAFGRPGKIVDIEQAIMLLGLRSVNLMALSFALTLTSSGRSTTGFDHGRYWTLATVTTVATRWLAARFARGLRDEAFLAGLLCDFVQLVLAERAPERYAPVLEALRASPSRPLQEVERELLGADHAALGERLLAAWGLPAVVCRAVGAHHDPAALADAASPEAQLAAMLQVASACAELYAGGDLAAHAATLRDLASARFEMDSAACAELLAEVEQKAPEVTEILGLETSDTAGLLRIREEATQLLVRESLALNDQMHDVTRDARRLEERNTDLEQRATTDALTGLRNRGFFDETLQAQIDAAAQHGHGLGLLLLDVDHFKSVNDTHGHPVGDALLRAMAAVVREHAGAGDCACRYGGEEIALICPDVGREALRERAEALRTAIGRTSVPAPDGPVQRTVSIGGSHTPPGQTATLVELVETADAELYRAKSEGRDRVRLAGDGP